MNTIRENIDSINLNIKKAKENVNRSDDNVTLHWQADSLPLSHLGSPCILIVFLKLFE